jgi:DNA-binding MarR family transcriptional regulator
MLSTKLLETLPQTIRTLRHISAESLGGVLTLQQLRVLALVQEGQSQTQIAQTLYVSLAAVSKVISILAKKKLITRKSGDDRRTSILTLTPKGKNTLEKITGYVKSKLDEGISLLDKDEQDQLHKGLLLLDQLMLEMKEV